MPDGSESESRKLLGRLRDTMAEEAAGQARLDKITHLTADSMGTEVCSIYLFRDEDTLELCATEGLNKEAVHQTRMKLGEGLVENRSVSGPAVADVEPPDLAPLLDDEGRGQGDVLTDVLDPVGTNGLEVGVGQHRKAEAALGCECL